PGGRFVSAFAFPSTRAPSVLFTDPALELFSAREQAAVFAHELSHLEHGDRRRCYIASAISYGLVAGATLGAALAFEWLPPGLFISFWSIALIVAFAWRLARQKAHETESDLRALALCNDAEALISGLTKLTMAGRLPRRRSSELEHGASHPSLARRLHALRRRPGRPGPHRTVTGSDHRRRRRGDAAATARCRRAPTVARRAAARASGARRPLHGAGALDRLGRRRVDARGHHRTHRHDSP